MPGVHALVFPSSPAHLRGKRARCVHGEGWLEVGAAGVSRGRAPTESGSSPRGGLWSESPFPVLHLARSSLTSLAHACFD